MSKYTKLRKYSSDIHVYEFDPNKIRFDATIGVRGKLERLSKIKGEPREDEYVAAKLNGGFFAMNGSTEFIGSFVDEGLYYQGSSHYYPTVVYWKDTNKMTMELRPDQARHAHYQKNAHFAIGVPWTLIVDGKTDFTFTKNELIKVFGHPYQKHPRTLLGQKKDGAIVWVVADGRKKTTAGINITQSAELMLSLGCVFAVNLDGGGSSEMIVNDKILNKVSDGSERAIGTAFMAYGKKKVTPTPPSNTNNTTPPSNGKTGRVTATLLNMRSGPSTKYGVIGTLKNGTVVNIVSSDSGWYKIRYNNKDAYVSGSYIKLI